MQQSAVRMLPFAASLPWRHTRAAAAVDRSLQMLLHSPAAAAGLVLHTHQQPTQQAGAHTIRSNVVGSMHVHEF
jgi:hypothetical protein